MSGKVEPLTATKIKENWAKGCDCNKCEYCYVKRSIRSKQKALFEPLIKRAKELLEKK